jgi:pimeloyl-ACP methyl ester carboxylesterase
MELLVNGARTYCYSGGKAFDAAKPTVVFIHGVLNDHSVWVLQSRYLAHHGWNVLAPDLPGHCRSAGEAPATVEQAAAFIHALLDAVGVSAAALVGHSWGSLIALEAASRLAQRVSHLVLVGTAYPMKVSQKLLDASLNEPEVALRMVNLLSRSTLAPPSSALGPGTWVYGASLALGRRVMRSNPWVNLFHRGFLACSHYTGGQEAMAQACAPTMFLLGLLDQMTPASAAQPLIAQAQATGKRVAVVHLPVGHHQMTECPDGTLLALRDFLST